MQTEVEQLVATLPSGGITRASRLGLALAPQLQPGAWRELVAHVTRLARTTTGARQTLTAWIGDVLVHHEARGRGWITECAEAAGLDAGTLRNAKMVCIRIPVSCRHDALSWTHHCEVGLAFVEPNEIERWLTLAEAESLSTADLRRRIRAHIAGTNRTAPQRPAESTIATFRLMRDLRATDRAIGQHRDAWQHWSPTAARLALRELGMLTAFVDTMRAHALAEAAARPRDIAAN